MVDIWEYANHLPRISLIDANGDKFIGKIIAVMDALEADDEDDNIVVEADSGEIRIFYPDEIESIEVLND